MCGCANHPCSAGYVLSVTKSSSLFHDLTNLPVFGPRSQTSSFGTVSPSACMTESYFHIAMMDLDKVIEAETESIHQPTVLIKNNRRYDEFDLPNTPALSRSGSPPSMETLTVTHFPMTKAAPITRHQPHSRSKPTRPHIRTPHLKVAKALSSKKDHRKRKVYGEVGMVSVIPVAEECSKESDYQVILRESCEGVLRNLDRGSLLVQRREIQDAAEKTFCLTIQRSPGFLHDHQA